MIFRVYGCCLPMCGVRCSMITHSSLFPSSGLAAPWLSTRPRIRRGLGFAAGFLPGSLGLGRMVSLNSNRRALP